MRWLHCVGGDAPVNFGRRHRRAASPKKRRRRRAGGHQISFKISGKYRFFLKILLLHFFLFSSFSHTFSLFLRFLPVSSFPTLSYILLLYALPPHSLPSPLLRLLF